MVRPFFGKSFEEELVDSMSAGDEKTVTSIEGERLKKLIHARGFLLTIERRINNSVFDPVARNQDYATQMQMIARPEIAKMKRDDIRFSTQLPNRDVIKGLKRIDEAKEESNSLVTFALSILDMSISEARKGNRTKEVILHDIDQILSRVNGIIELEGEIMQLEKAEAILLRMANMHQDAA